MTSIEDLSVLTSIEVYREVDGLEMGVFSSGVSYLSARSLARLCGVDHTAIIRHAESWALGARESKLARFIESRGFSRATLFIKLPKQSAFTDDVCTLLIEYYAFEAKERNGVALDNARKLMTGGLRLFVYGALGYNPASSGIEKWQRYYDRVMLNQIPVGYFSVFSELSQFLLTAMRAGLVVDQHTVPDGSVGIYWARHWRESGLETKYGPPTKFPHKYPPDFPQAQANDVIEANIFPDVALGDFRSWLHVTYIPEYLPSYLQRKVKSKQLDSGRITPILNAFTVPSEPPMLPAMPPGKGTSPRPLPPPMSSAGPRPTTPRR